MQHLDCRTNENGSIFLDSSSPRTGSKTNEMLIKLRASVEGSKTIEMLKRIQIY
jgi:hypothetical protein